MTNIPIFLSSDDNYAPFVATTIASICDNTKSFCDFYILDGGITEYNQNRICELKKQFNNFSIEFLKINPEDFSSLDYKNRAEYVSISTYNRFLIPQLKPELDKVLYSDVDVIILGDIQEMYDEDLGEYSIGAVWEELFFNTAEFDKHAQSLNLSKEHKYFSAGNIIMDCKKWREENIAEKLFEVERKNRDVIKCADQDVLNIYFDNNYKQLAQKYCYTNQKFDFYSKHDVLIRHYNGHIKPWHINPNNKTSLFYTLDEFWHYAKMTPFYDELLANTLDEEQQKKNIRLLQYWKNVNRVFAMKFKKEKEKV